MAPMSNGDTNNGEPSSSSEATSSPTRPTNNYASINTPIASAKRPTTKKRTPVPSSSSATKPMSTTSASGGSAGGGTPKTPIRTPKMTTNDNTSATTTTTTSNKARYANLSPMHNVKPVPRDSHHSIPAPQKVKGGKTDDIGHCISATESSLSIVTEAPTTTGGESPSSSNSASWVGRKVDAIFSPVLSFLNGASATAGGEEDDGGGEDKAFATDVEGGTSAAKANLASLLTKEKKSENESEVEKNEEVQKMVREALLQVSKSYTPSFVLS